MTNRPLFSAAVSMLTLILLSAILAACRPTDEGIANGDDPIAALRVAVESSRYTGDFWVREQERNASRYADAVRFCRGLEYADYPNCRAVMQAKAVVDAAASPRLQGKTYTGTANPFMADSTNTP